MSAQYSNYSRAELIKWLRELNEPDQYQPKREIHYLCLLNDDPIEPIRDFELQKDYDPVEIAKIIEKLALSLANHQEGVAKIRLEAYCREQEGMVTVVRYTILSAVTGSSTDMGMVRSASGAMARGGMRGGAGPSSVGNGMGSLPEVLVQEGIYFGHKSFEIAMGTTGHLMNRMERDIDKKDKRIEELESEVKRLNKVINDMQDNEHKRKLDVMKMRQWQEFMGDIAQVIRGMLPIALSAMLGKPLVDTDMNPLLMSLEPMLEKIDSEEKLAKLAEVFGQFNMVPLLELYKAFQQRRAAKEAKKKEEQEKIYKEAYETGKAVASTAADLVPFTPSQI
jgi:hypothetical protein